MANVFHRIRASPPPSLTIITEPNHNNRCGPPVQVPKCSHFSDRSVNRPNDSPLPQSLGKRLRSGPGGRWRSRIWRRRYRRDRGKHNAKRSRTKVSSTLSKCCNADVERGRLIQLAALRRNAGRTGACLRHDNHTIENPGAYPTVMTAGHGKAKANSEKNEFVNGDVLPLDRSRANG